MYTRDEQLRFAGRDLNLVATAIRDTVRVVMLEIANFNMLQEQGLLPELTGQQGQSTRAATSEWAVSITLCTSPAMAGSIGTGGNTDIVPTENGC